MRTHLDPGLNWPRYQILGSLRVLRQDGTEVPVRQRLHQVALAVLLAYAGEPCPRPVLEAVLWGSDPPGDPHGSLRTVMHGLRQQVPGLDAGSLAAAGGGYVLLAAGHDVDARLFRALTARGRAAWYGGDAGAAARLLGLALAMWREPELGALPDVPALAPARGLLAREHRHAQDMLADALLALGRYETLTCFLRGVLAPDPGREHAWAQLLRAAAAWKGPGTAAALLAEARASGPAGPELEYAARQVSAAAARGRCG